MTALPRPVHILLIEDDPAITTVIRVALEGEGITCDPVASLAARNAALAQGGYDVLVTDVMLPDGNGLDGLNALEPIASGTLPVIVLSAQNTLDTAVRASEEGAFDYLPKPFDLDELIATIRAAAETRHDHPSEEDGEGTLAIETGAGPTIIGRAATMQGVYRTLARVAPTELSVLVLGESGTGKELVAQAIHHSSRRRAGPFVAVNMAAIPRELIESELFGHERGAFTGAVARTSGRFEQARGGTLFLDEIGDMPLDAQTRLLRVLQTGEYSPIGSARAFAADVRIVAATNRDLAADVADGRFREDLYFRLNVIPIALPPLRERASDIPLLATHLLATVVDQGLPARQFDADALGLLAAHNWPGNVRELGNVVQRLALLARSSRITADDVRRLLDGAPVLGGSGEGTELDVGAALDQAIDRWLGGEAARAAMDAGTLHEVLVERVEQRMFEAALARCGGNQLHAARLLGINRNTLRLKRQAAQMPRDDRRVR